MSFGPRGRQGPPTLRVCYIYAFGGKQQATIRDTLDSIGYELGTDIKLVFFIPFLGIFCFWLGYTFMLSSNNDFTLASKIAVLLPLGGNAYVLIAVTAAIGGIAAGIAGVFGQQCKELLKK